MNDQEEIAQIIARWHDATRRGQLDEILPLMADDVVFLTPGNPPMMGKEPFAGGFRSILEKGRIESHGELREIHVSGFVAYSWTDLTVKMIPHAGDAVVRSGPALTIFRKDPSGSWVVYRDANMLTE